jgi:predicted kinase
LELEPAEPHRVVLLFDELGTIVAMAGSQFSEFEGGSGGSGSDRRDARCGRLIIVAGLPATGKTTLALALERDLRAVRLCADDWMTELGIDLLDASARARVEQLQWRLAQRLLELAAVVVVEWGTWSRAERDALRERARALGAAAELRFLDASPSELWRRIEARDREHTQASRALTLEDVEGWAAQIEPPEADELALYDPPLR